ncbi:hypothetical protein [Mycolicibacterium fortuitum]|uniref:hypothetical protein n=1 Tax=Mycolicibacterium fortuitum TaxID=1766 RepID=UPI002626FF1C|nr:hypothetical protein [Mycolicibacterium fortuitum]
MAEQMARRAPVREATYKGDRTAMFGQIVGPDRRGIFWRATDAVHNAETDRTRVVFRPVPKADIERAFAPLGGPEAVRQRLAAAGKLGIAGI